MAEKEIEKGKDLSPKEMKEVKGGIAVVAPKREKLSLETEGDIARMKVVDKAI